ncbi:unnamed protein product, partial [Brugia timori]
MVEGGVMRMPTPPLLTHNNREFVDFEKSNEVDQRAETFGTVEAFLNKYADPKLATPIKTVPLQILESNFIIYASQL